MEVKNIIAGLRRLSHEEVIETVKRVFDNDPSIEITLETTYDTEYGIVFKNASNAAVPGGYSPQSKLVFGYFPWQDTPEQKGWINFYPDMRNYEPQSEDTQLLPLIPSVGDARQTKQALMEVLTFLKNKYRKPVSPGCVKAYVGLSKLWWVSKRSNSDNIGKIANCWYLAKGLNQFIQVHNTEETTILMYRNAVALREYRNLAGQWWHQDLCATIYSRYDVESDSVGTPFAYVRSVQAPLRYRSYTRPNGDVVYTKDPLPYSRYWAKPLHGYSERIESFLESEDLFKKGKVDLYARRPKEETPFLGWELEACFGSAVKTAQRNECPTDFKKLLEKVVFCKNDGSIRPSGFETVSIPATLDYWKESGLRHALDTMRSPPYSMRSYEHSSCGFHVHVSRAALSVLDLQKLERFMHNPDNKEFLNAIAGRGASTYQNYYPDVFFNGRKDHTIKKYRTTSYSRDLYCPTDTVIQSQSYFGDFTEVPFVKLCRVFVYQFGLGNVNWMENYYSFCKRIALTLSETSPNMQPYRLQNAVDMYLSYDGVCLTEDEVLTLMFEIAKGTSHAVQTSEYTRFTFRAMLETIYPRKFKFEPNKKPEEDLSWKCAVRKTKLPIGRQHNQKACVQMAGPLGKAAAGRYDVLNTTNTNTVEFRLFKGTMNPDSVYRYLEFVDAIVRFVPSTSATNEGLHFQMFLNWLSKDSFNVLRYEHLVAFLVSKNFIQRSAIRKRDLISPQENDNGKVDAVLVGPPTPTRTSIELSGSSFAEPGVVCTPTSFPVLSDLDPDPSFDAPFTTFVARTFV